MHHFSAYNMLSDDLRSEILKGRKTLVIPMGRSRLVDAASVESVAYSIISKRVNNTVDAAAATLVRYGRSGRQDRLLPSLEYQTRTCKPRAATNERALGRGGHLCDNSIYRGRRINHRQL